MVGLFQHFGNHVQAPLLGRLPWTFRVVQMAQSRLEMDSAQQCPDQLLQFNNGEYIAWHSAAALKAYIDDLRRRLPGYTINWCAQPWRHRGERALREGAQVDNYAMCQAAVPAEAF